MSNEQTPPEAGNASEETAVNNKSPLPPEENLPEATQEAAAPEPNPSCPHDSPFQLVSEDKDEHNTLRRVLAARMAGGVLVSIEVEQQGSPPMVALAFVTNGRLSDDNPPKIS